MSLKIHLRFKDYKFLLQALFVHTQEMISAEVVLQCVVIDKVLLLPAVRPAVADMASFMPVATMCVKFVVSVEALSAKSALGVSLEAALLEATRLVIAVLLVSPKLRVREEFMFMREDLLVSSTEVAGAVST